MELRPQLQPRLRAIADLVPDGSLLTDVGTDHGYVPVALVLEGRIRGAIASDIGAEPLAHAVRTAEKYEVADRVDFRLCDGLAAVKKEETDCVVIAGMGGDNIVSILTAAPWTKEGATLLLQPMSKAEVLRRWLSETGYAVVAEQLVEDKGIVYPILTVRGGSMAPATEAQAWGGFLLRDDPLWGAYLTERGDRLRRAACGQLSAKDPAEAEAGRSLMAVADTLTAWREEWQHGNGT